MVEMWGTTRRPLLLLNNSDCDGNGVVPRVYSVHSLKLGCKEKSDLLLLLHSVSSEMAEFRLLVSPPKRSPEEKF